MLSAALAVAAVIASCSKTTFVYNQLDKIIPWYLNRLVSLDYEQEVLLDSLLQTLLDWHRTEELPTYKDLLVRLNNQLDGEIKEIHLMELEERAELAWTRLERRSLDGLLLLGSSLNSRQLDQFFDSLKKQQAEYEEKYLIRNNAEFAKDAEEEILSFSKNYLGPLNASQIESVKLASVQLKRSDQIWLSERARWLDRVQIIMARNRGWEDKMRNLILTRDANLSEDYRSVYDRNASVIRAVFVELLNSASEKQKQKLKRKIARWIDDISSLVDLPIKNP